MPSVRMYVIRPASYKRCATDMVWRAPKPNLRLASCCNVEVMNGGDGLRLAGFASTNCTVKSRLLIACTANSAWVASEISNLSSFLPAR